jgi:predicted Zn-dependent peptidase
MSLESTSGRVEHQAHHMLMFGRPFDAQDVVRQIDAVDAAAVIRAAHRIAAGPLTLTALGPIQRLEDYGRVTGRLAA